MTGSAWACGARGPTVVVTDLGILRPDPATSKLMLTDLHPGVTPEQAVAATGWALRRAPSLGRTAPPTEQELTTLRALQAPA